MLRLTLNGAPMACSADATLLQALQASGCNIPALCHDARLKPAGACRLCLVEVAGEPRPVASCTARPVEGMAIRTDTPALRALCRTNLSLLAAHYPADAVMQDPAHPFHRLLDEYGVIPGNQARPALFHDDSHPYLGVDMDRCISCYRCVRICDEVQGQSVWWTWQRGEQTHVAPDAETLLEGGCVSCGACVDSCPSGALFDKRSSAPERWTRSTCVYCGVGCQMEVGSQNDRVVQVRPADSPVNRGHLCVKGRYAFEFNHATDRASTPMLRQDGEWQAVSWEEALDYTAARLQDIVERDGADAIGVLGSARATNEENYLAQKFARVVLGTNNVDCCARVCHTPSAKALKTMLGTGAATNSFDDIERTQLFLLCGCNPTENHPIVGARVKQAVRNGAQLIVIDPRRIELADYATLHLPVRIGHNIALFNAMAAAIVEEGLLDQDFAAGRVDGLDKFSAFIRDYAPEKVAQACGIPAATIRAAARLYAGTRPAMCFHGLGVTEHTQGTEGVMALINLALLTGNLGKPGAGINPLRGQNNVQGAAQMGCDPNSLTGAQSIPQSRARFESIWQAPIPESHGLDLMEMMDAASAGKLKALWAFGYDVYLTLANANQTGHALGNLSLVIIQDLFMNETGRAFGHVFLPAASVFEKDGTFMNSDRRVQRVRQAIPPYGDSRPDWWIIQQLAARMGHASQFSFAGPQAIWNEIRTVWPAGAGLSYARLEHESINWPCPAEDHPGTPFLHGGQFAIGPRATLACIADIPSAEQCDADYPFMLTTGRTLAHFNAGTMTYRTPNAVLQASDTLDMALSDAQRLGLQSGEIVQLVSRHGSAVLPLRISGTVKPGELFTSFHRAELLINRITSPYRDRMVKSPEYKVTAVRVNRL
ncbi:formate dehydrogenase subunit alpha [Janthinobacterium sp. 17J80-10]|uniref:formate dehydrogenase subunit alpha n=1 Tax=Janthinobacterium sp. 17J80-10 TaxID=2497863 RepID=UPI0010052BC3|nr:formate dehydrogenase subunit alpha [Janthinobacterium sp. 17J80-10]QAU34522.1 formate dehydrogenase subunit alpha [Janthinobacterium sp. 17J80-10]